MFMREDKVTKCPSSKTSTFVLRAVCMDRVGCLSDHVLVFSICCMPWPHLLQPCSHAPSSNGGVLATTCWAQVELFARQLFTESIWVHVSDFEVRREDREI